MNFMLSKVAGLHDSKQALQNGFNNALMRTQSSHIHEHQAHLLICIMEVCPKEVCERVHEVTLGSTLVGEVLELPGFTLHKTLEGAQD